MKNVFHAYVNVCEYLPTYPHPHTRSLAFSLSGPGNSDIPIAVNTTIQIFIPNIVPNIVLH